MISCITSKGVEYITRVEHFQNLMDEEVYQTLIEFVNNNKHHYENTIKDLKSEISNLEFDLDEIDNDFNDLQCTHDDLVDKIYEIIEISNITSKEDVIERLKEIVNYKKNINEDIINLLKKIT